MIKLKALKPLVIVGATGSGEIASSVFEDINKVKPQWNILGFLNDVSEIDDHIGKYKIIGRSEQLLDYIQKGCHVHYTFHFNVKKKNERVNAFKELNIPLEAHASGVHPLAYLNPSSRIGAGSLMLPYSATSGGSIVGDFCHMYTSSFLGHDTYLSSYSTLAAHSVLGARIKMGEGVHIGLNATIREDVVIGKYAIVGMASNVISDIGDYEIFVGNPAKKNR
ncbi:hypothetical protein K8354_09650 [Polaribacter litorisediminis]|uniref:PglD-related sugar-binding protein n=1 Tax=Polaribacter litorisediminis TaxID=1908341 RepID=UPI001CBCAC2E|nr:hypothetical protein [Polaribacter litorisediminis]UAM96606.1 hypothetical protein K8354_09650 [Polaribacter litorisediminis]